MLYPSKCYTQYSTGFMSFRRVHSAEDGTVSNPVVLFHSILSRTYTSELIGRT